MTRVADAFIDQMETLFEHVWQQLAEVEGA